MRKDAKIALMVILVLMVLVVIIWGHSPRSGDIELQSEPTPPSGQAVAVTETTTSHTPPVVDTTRADLELARHAAPAQPPGNTTSITGHAAMINNVPTLSNQATLVHEGAPPPTRPVALAPSTRLSADTTSATRDTTPSSTPQGPSTPVKAQFLSHKVAKGENYTILARRYYKDERKWRLIYEANKIPPESLKADDTIKIPVLLDPKPADDAASKKAGTPRVVDTRTGTPAPDAAKKDAPTDPARKTPPVDTAKKDTPADAAKAPRTYTVKKGESFYSIARAIYRDAAKWQPLYKHNQARLPKPSDPGSLREGTVIELPNLASAQ